VLVLDVRGMSGSAAAVLEGFVRHRPAVRVAGVIFNRVGGPAHRAMLAESCRRAVPDCAQLGWVPRDARLELPSRHLGLVQAGERRDLEDFIENASTLIGETVDIAALADLARPCRLDGSEPARPLPPLGQTIAVARDEAFAFTYHAVLEGWRAAGATLSFFSPLADQAPEPDACAVYLPGGYPELHAGRLAANRRFLDGTRAAAARGAAVFGECGGYMTLGRVLRDADGAPHEMLGLLPLETSFAARRLHRGYRRARRANACPLGEAGEAFRGHEFHYATVTAEGPAEPLFDTACAAGRPLGPAGLRCGRVMGSFVHLVDLANSF
ncbi:MAG: cobyrinate a,c-diamide synthase, partial [Alphaproteobacteria bacterium]|nr:cobyrinate a,c-diamide synthase [Alphaproteobacteria bacterium]